MVVGPITKVERVPHSRTALNFVWEVFDEELYEERVRVGVKHADFVLECVFEKRVEGVHLQLAPLKHAKTLLERLVDDGIACAFQHRLDSCRKFESPGNAAFRRVGVLCPPPLQAEYRSAWPRL